MTSEQTNQTETKPVQPIDYRDLWTEQMLSRFAGKAMGAAISAIPHGEIIDTAKLAPWAFDMAEAMVREFQIRKAREMKP